MKIQAVHEYADFIPALENRNSFLFFKAMEDYFFPCNFELTSEFDVSMFSGFLCNFILAAFGHNDDFASFFQRDLDTGNCLHKKFCNRDFYGIAL